MFLVELNNLPGLIIAGISALRFRPLQIFQLNEFVFVSGELPRRFQFRPDFPRHPLTFRVRRRNDQGRFVLTDGRSVIRRQRFMPLVGIHFTELAGDELHGSAAKSYLKALAENKSVLLVSPTWAEIEAVTEKIRAELKSSGRLALDEKEFQVFDSLSWTEAQKRDARQYRPGIAIHFHRRDMVLKKGKRLRWSPWQMIH